MPRVVDRNEREQAIIDTALELLFKEGPSALSVRRIARELGGSVTLVTHYFPQIDELLRAVSSRLVQEQRAELEAIQAGHDDPIDNLRELISWMLPLDAKRRREERARVLFAAERDSGLNVQDFYEAMERSMRALLRQHLRPLVPSDQVEDHVDLLRAFHNGVVLSSVEHPALWTKKRQLRAMDLLLDSIGLTSSRSASGS